MQDITIKVPAQPVPLPDGRKRPPWWAYENPVVQAELVINGNGNT